VAAQERAARAVAAAVRTLIPGNASFVYCILGIAYRNLGDFNKAIEYHAQHLAIAKEVGDRAGEGKAYGNLGNAYQSQGDYAKAIEYHTLHLAIAKEVGDRAGEGRAYANLGIAYDAQGDFNKAIEYHTMDLAIAKEVGDRAGEGTAYGNLGIVYQSQGDFSKAIEYHGKHLAIAKEVGDRAGEGRAYGNLGTGHMHLNECVKAVAYFEAQHVMATSLKLAYVQSEAALNMGVALTRHVRAARQGPVAGADQAPGPHSHSSARRAWMIECARRQSGSRLPLMVVVVHLQNCTWRTSPFLRAKRTRR
jgi:tetratricopeptide (TPR) repeat protein